MKKKKSTTGSTVLNESALDRYGFTGALLVFHSAPLEKRQRYEDIKSIIKTRLITNFESHTQKSTELKKTQRRSSSSLSDSKNWHVKRSRTKTGKKTY
jgi:hypothetical protein